MVRLISVSIMVCFFLGFYAVWPVDSVRQQSHLPAQVSSQDSTRYYRPPSDGWSVLSPFAALPCKLAGGGVQSTACSPDEKPKVWNDQHDSLVARLQSLERAIAAGEFEHIDRFNESYFACWHGQQNAQLAEIAVKDGECDSQAAEAIVEQAKSSILAASARGDYFARTAYVKLFGMRRIVQDERLKAYEVPPESNNVPGTGNALALRSDIKRARQQLISYIDSLNDISSDLSELRSLQAQLIVADEL